MLTRSSGYFAKRNPYGFPLFVLCTLGMALVLATACKTSQATTDTSNTSSLPNGTRSYVGLLPCADCAGIATTLHLMANEEFRLEQMYQGKRAEPFLTTGRYQLSSTGLRLSPKPARDAAIPSQFEWDGKALVQLDMEGQAIEGALADRYRLQPADLRLNAGERVLWVDDARVDCTGVGPQSCLRVMRGAGQGEQLLPPDADWTLLYQDIEGYTFVPGEVAQLVVRETHRSAATTPADASTINYRLVRELARYGDARTRVHDIWALDELGGQRYISRDDQAHPVLEINVQEMTVMGTDGCNRFEGKLEALGAEAFRLGPRSATEMYCLEGAAITAAFNRALSDTRSYRLEGLKLHLLDAAGKEMMVLRKVD